MILIPFLETWNLDFQCKNLDDLPNTLIMQLHMIA